MSKKPKNGNKKKAKKGNKPAQKRQPVAVPQRKIVTLDVILGRIYSKENLATTCLRQCTCCRVACPQMKFCEASDIIDHIWATWSREEKKRVLVTAVKYYFSDSLIKPCPMLVGSECKVYDRRPLNCRLYGLWPSDDWEKRVAGFAEATGLPREKLPLNTQCPNVKRARQACPDCKGVGKMYKQEDGSLIPDANGNIVLNLTPVNCQKCGGLGKFTPPPLTSEQIKAMFDALDNADKVLGVSELKVSTNWNYRTFHDWVLLKFWGESNLVKWTNLILTTTPEQRQGIIEAFEQQADKII
jgi:Fe-S-cluster containining protein